MSSLGASPFKDEVDPGGVIHYTAACAVWPDGLTPATQERQHGFDIADHEETASPQARIGWAQEQARAHQSRHAGFSRASRMKPGPADEAGVG